MRQRFPRRFAIAVAAVVSALPGASALADPWPVCGAVEAFPGADWGAADALAQGWDAAALRDAKAGFEMAQSASVVIVHKGRLIADWGDSAEKFTAQSVRKSLLSALVGVLVDDGALSLDATLGELGVDDTDPPLTAIEKTATLRHLLRSRSNIFHSALYEVGGWKRMRASLAEQKRANPDQFPPGGMWFYNNWDFNALGTIVETAAGAPIGAVFAEAVAGPIAMQDFDRDDVQYTDKNHGAERHFGNVSDHRAYMFDISTRDLARFGLLYLACGVWDGDPILSRDWIEKSLDGVDTRLGRQAQFRDTGFGDYGFLWQIDRPGSRRFGDLATRAPVYFATGNRGHVLGVFPYLDLVIAHQVGTRGGVGVEAQMKRARNGSPTVSDDEMTTLFKAIIAAHPDGADALIDP